MPSIVCRVSTAGCQPLLADSGWYLKLIQAPESKKAGAGTPAFVA
jgi:hypothetical protein